MAKAEVLSFTTYLADRGKEWSIDEEITEKYGDDYIHKMTLRFKARNEDGDFTERALQGHYKGRIGDGFSGYSGHDNCLLRLLMLAFGEDPTAEKS